MNKNKIIFIIKLYINIRIVELNSPHYYLKEKSKCIFVFD